MKFDARGLLKLKLFDESHDLARAGPVYAKSVLLTVGVVSSAVLALVALVLTMNGHANAMDVLALAAGISAFTSGLEWNAGLKARALNELFVALVVVVGIALLDVGP